MAAVRFAGIRLLMFNLALQVAVLLVPLVAPGGGGALIGQPTL